MTSEKENRKNTEFEFEQMIVAEYLKYGSVDELISANEYSLPISFAGIHRIVDKWGIVKAAGPNKPLTECISFFVRLVEEQIPLESLYKNMPPSFTPSMTTLHRIYRHVKEEIKKEIENRSMRRYGTAVLLTPQGNPFCALVGRDTSPARPDVGKKFGSHSFPMGFSKFGEEKSDSILRVLQKEVFTRQLLDGEFPAEILAKIRNPKPFMYLDITDVRVAVYTMELSESLSSLDNFESFKLKNYEYVDLWGLALSGQPDGSFRLGMREIAGGYIKHLKSPDIAPSYITSDLNLVLAEV